MKRTDQEANAIWEGQEAQQKLSPHGCSYV